jgi:uncharacterized protein (TIGR02284 family)
MAAELPREELLFSLNELIETCLDGKQGFLEAATNAFNAELKRICLEYSQQRAQFARELQDEVRRLGGDPDQGGSVAGALHRRWMDVKSAITGRDDDAIIAECERGEDVAIGRYREVLDRDLPAAVLKIVLPQLEAIQEAHHRFRDLRQARSHHP